MQPKNYTHKGIDFQWAGGLNIYRKQDLLPMKLQLNNGSPSFRLNRNTWLSVKQLKSLIKRPNVETSGR